MGSGHSFNRISDVPADAGTLVSLERMDSVIDVNKGKGAGEGGRQ